jgi:hypothetical protein
VNYGGDSGNRIFVLYWRCPLIRVSVIRGSTVYICLGFHLANFHDIRGLFAILSRKFKFYSNLTRITGTLPENLSASMRIFY